MPAAAMPNVANSMIVFSFFMSIPRVTTMMMHSGYLLSMESKL